MRWTYDPLRRINAALNIARLGATAGTYHESYYGPMEGINAGIPSDRLVADWDLSAAYVAALADGSEPAPPVSSGDPVAVEIPKDLDKLLSTDLDTALSERLRVRAALTAAFAKGYRITGFDTGACRYLLTKS